MKKTILIISAITFLSLFFGYASHPWLGKTMSLNNVKKRWGNEKFNENNFKLGSQQLKAKMAYSLIKENKMLGLTTLEIKKKLGDFDGHYFSESYPTYIIEEAKKKNEETWQLVFLIDNNKKVKSIIVHKNCCD